MSNWKAPRSDNVIYFPGYLYLDGFYLHHGKKYRTLHEWADDVSYKDFQRAVAWEERRLGVTEPPRVTRGGGNAA